MDKKVNQKENKTDIIIVNKTVKQMLIDTDKQLQMLQREMQHVSAKKQAIITSVIAQAGYGENDVFDFDQDLNLVLKK